jgi:hypothetical protein
VWVADEDGKFVKLAGSDETLGGGIVSGKNTVCFKGVII